LRKRLRSNLTNNNVTLWQTCLLLFVINIRHIHHERRCYVFFRFFFFFREKLEHGILLRCKSREQKYTREIQLYKFRREQYLSSYHARGRILGVSKESERAKCWSGWSLKSVFQGSLERLFMRGISRARSNSVCICRMIIYTSNIRNGRDARYRGICAI